jgi:hypothetical protein
LGHITVPSADRDRRQWETTPLDQG